MVEKKAHIIRAVVNNDGARKGGRMTPTPSAAYIPVPKPTPVVSPSPKATATPPKK